MFRIFFVIIMVLALSGCQNENQNNANTGVVGENEPVTRAEAARMVSLNNYSIEEINSMERKIVFKDTDISKWYDKYINAAYCGKLIAGVDNENFAPDEYLTLRQAQFLLDKLQPDNKVKLQYAQEDKDKPIPCNIWTAAYEKAMNTQKLKTIDMKIYADRSACKSLGENFYITELGLTYYEGYENLTTDNQITAIVNNKTIAAVKNINMVKMYENMEVTDGSDKYIAVKLPGGTRKFDVEESSAKAGDIVKIEINNGKYSIK